MAAEAYRSVLAEVVAYTKVQALVPDFAMAANTAADTALAVADNTGAAHCHTGADLVDTRVVAAGSLAQEAHRRSRVVALVDNLAGVGKGY